MSFELNSVVFIVIFTLAEAMNISNLKVKENKQVNLQPDNLNSDLNHTPVNDRENLMIRIKRWEHEILAIDQTSKMPVKKILGLYVQFWTDVFSPSMATARYAPKFMEMCKKLYLQLKSYY